MVEVSGVPEEVTAAASELAVVALKAANTLIRPQFGLT